MAELPRDAGSAGLEDRDFELLMLLADGELVRDPVRRAEAEALLARDPCAAAVFADLQAAKQALHALVVGDTAAAGVDADLSMLRGRVMTRLPAATPTRQAERGHDGRGLWAWLGSLGFGKGSIAIGAAVLAAVVLVVVQSRPSAPAAEDGAAIASHDVRPALLDPGEPAVIIEEMDVEGSVTVTPGAQPSQPTVIWHFQPVREGEG